MTFDVKEEAARVGRWLFGVAIYYGLAYLTINEWRYWKWGQVCEARVTKQEKGEVRGNTYVRIRYSFRDPVLGQFREEQFSVTDKGQPIPKTVHVRYIPGVARMSRSSDETFVVPVILFLAINVWVIWTLYQVIRNAANEAAD